MNATTPDLSQDFLFFHRLNQWVYQEASLPAGWQQQVILHNSNDEASIVYNDNTAILVVRGSDDLQDWLENAQFWRVGVSAIGYIHNGFAEAYQEILHSIIDWLPLLQNKTVYATGHSRGGAIATLVATYLYQIDKNTFHETIHFSQSFAPKVITFGCPRIGDESFKDQVESLHMDIIRIHSSLDPVANMPSTSLGYMHVGKSIEIGPSESWVSRTFYSVLGKPQNHTLAQYLNYLEQRVDNLAI